MSLPPQPRSPGRRTWYRRKRVWAAAALVAGVGWLTYTPTTTYRLGDAGEYEVLQFERNTQYVLNPKPSEPAGVQRLRLKYYSDLKAPDLMIREGERVAPAVFPIADSLGMDHVLVQPTRPLSSSRHWPLATFSMDVTYERRGGRWIQTSPVR